MRSRRAPTPNAQARLEDLLCRGPMALALLLLLPATLRGSESEGPPKREGDAYPLTTCPVSGETLGAMGNPVVYVHDGREIRFCCKGCIPAFEKDPAQYLGEIDSTVTADQGPLYPLKECVVSGKKLGSMGEPVAWVHGNRLVRLCCKGCIPTFQKQAAENLKKLDAAVVEAQKAAYPLDTCVASGKKLGAMGEPVDLVHASRLVRFCCKGCIPAFEKDPATYTAKLDAAVWTCPMHPQVREGSAKRCPLCDGELVQGKTTKKEATARNRERRSALPRRPLQHR